MDSGLGGVRIEHTVASLLTRRLVWSQLVVKQLEERIRPAVVPAVLEHEAIPNLTGRPAGIRGRAGSSSRQLESPLGSEHALDALVASLKRIYCTLAELGVDPEITAQLFKQVRR